MIVCNKLEVGLTNSLESLKLDLCVKFLYRINLFE